MVESSFFIKNRRKLFSELSESSIALFHSNYQVFKTCDEVYPFQVNKNFYYLTGLNQDNIILLIGNVNGKYIEKLFIDENDPVEVKWVGAKYYKEEASFISGIRESDIHYTKDFKRILFDYFQPNRYSMGMVRSIYLDLEKQPIELYRTFATEFSKEIKEEYPYIKIVDSYSLMIDIRSIKEHIEIEEMKKSIETTNRAILNVMAHKDELKNEAIAEAYYNFVLKSEDKVTQFDSICAAGMNGTTLHYQDNNQEINNNDLLLMDVGVATNQYGSDITRTFPVSGKFTERQKEVYQEVLNVNKKCIEFVHDGMSWKEYNDFANDLLVKALIKLGKIKEPSELRNYYWHSIGHSLGLDTHDPGHRNRGLRAGMVVTVEPGLYLADEGIGIRIEDDVLITEGRAINLSKDIIKEIDDIEKFMAE